MTGGTDLSTSAGLRAEIAHTQAAFAASQADLTRVERERDEVVSAGQFALRQLGRMRADRDLARAELATAQREIAELRAQLDRHDHPQQENTMPSTSGEGGSR